MSLSIAQVPPPAQNVFLLPGLLHPQVFEPDEEIPADRDMGRAARATTQVPTLNKPEATRPPKRPLSTATSECCGQKRARATPSEGNSDRPPKPSHVQPMLPSTAIASTSVSAAQQSRSTPLQPPEVRPAKRSRPNPAQPAQDRPTEQPRPSPVQPEERAAKRARPAPHEPAEAPPAKRAREQPHPAPEATTASPPVVPLAFEAVSGSTRTQQTPATPVKRRLTGKQSAPEFPRPTPVASTPSPPPWPPAAVASTPLTPPPPPRPIDPVVQNVSEPQRKSLLKRRRPFQ